MTDAQGNWPKWMEDAWDWVTDAAQEVWNNTVKAAEIVFTEEFANELWNSIWNNLEADAGFSIGFAVEYRNGKFAFEASQRMDIISLQLKDGKLRFGHDGRSALNASFCGLTLGWQCDTYENLDGDKELSPPKYVDYGPSIGKSLVFVIGAHYNCSFSVLGVAQDLYDFINERW